MQEDSKPKGLPREKSMWRTNDHKGCYGRIMALYVYRFHKWLKIGEYCRECGSKVIFKRFEEGLINARDSD